MEVELLVVFPNGGINFKYLASFQGDCFVSDIGLNNGALSVGQYIGDVVDD